MTRINDVLHVIKVLIKSLRLRYVKTKDGYGRMDGYILPPNIISNKENVYIGNKVNIDWNSTIYAVKHKFVMGDDSGAAVGLTVVTDNHIVKIGEKLHTRGNDNLDGDNIIVEENVWIAANVTLLAGAKIGRGAIVGAGSVVRKCKIPPYSIVMGNPAKVVGFKFTPEEVLQHETILYPENERLSKELLEKNYKKYFIDRIDYIKQFVKI